MENGRHLLGVVLLFVAGITGGALSGSLFGGRHAQAQDEQVKARALIVSSITLVDKNGKTRLKAGTTDAKVFLDFMDQQEKPVISMYATESEAMIKYDTTRAAQGGADAMFGLKDGVGGMMMTSHRYQSIFWMTADSNGATQVLSTRWGDTKAPMESRVGHWANKEGAGLLVTGPARTGDPHFGGNLTIGYAPATKQMALTITGERGQNIWHAP